ncbi:YihY/virulence factor BrkB family protein [Methylobacter marinus]|uniref:YihY/virulence factor BrkB family protein n=1 Tax=Methylobacter marinus TaxID=34058 RepID=UPI00037F988B|nr:YhjD/YihY/BrkB family envelope integrity protein [Methylobacter marinus]
MKKVSFLSGTTYAFAVLVFAELLRAFGARSETKPVWRISLFTNINLMIVVAVSFGLQVWSQHNATLARFLKTSYLPFSDSFVLVALGAIPLLVLEVAKVVQHTRVKTKTVPEIADKTKTAPETAVNRFYQHASRVWTILCLALKKFSRIDGAQWAGAFSFYTFFSLFPLIVLFVTIASIFIDQDRAATEIIAYVETYVPMRGEMQSTIFDTMAGVVNARGPMGVVAFVMLGWAAMQIFTTLICATNRAWGAEISNWWRLPLKSLGFLVIMLFVVLFSIAVPVLAKMTKAWLLPMHDFSAWVYALGSIFIPSLMVFLSLSLFYKQAPSRPTRFVEVWVAALCATALLYAAENLFVIYLKDFATLNAVYGAFGGIMALLLWIYLSGCIFIFGACLCAAQAEGSGSGGNSYGALNPRN